MDFRLTPQQRDLKAGTRELLTRRFGRERLRASVGAPCTDRSWWRELGAAGFFALRLPEADGGTGLGLPEAVLVLEEAGRALLPGPLVATQLAAGTVKGAAEGESVVTALEFEVGSDALVAHLGDADAVLLPEGEGEGEGVGVGVRLAEAEWLRAAPAPGAETAREIPSVDPLTPLWRVPAPRRDGGVRTGLDGARLRLEGALLTAAEQVGSAFMTTELAARHARQREQFGRPIGSFQAVKHLCAGMLVRAELARSAVYAAALTADPLEVAGAKLLADEAAVRNARDCVQVHGGMGFTWEADVHLHLKRAWLRAERWQRADRAEELLAAGLTGWEGEEGGEEPEGSEEPETRVDHGA
ncbi:acyl-CoA dehydrogenase family protein [Streptomyces sp. GC420]|uniref:acyl-CoA dehydrogenase family protein n=1 Tax=Streptomyces sp. GC420 TaxID=2697568 RepID=UPI0014150239|nr:acyl-CoA dehydrogenase family protein [Streptomyces sp. GC420]NBM20796.1 acyl-CoA dehydrogenase [Streptomyces sp. GC420]